jgi:penicillin-binding protein 1A
MATAYATIASGGYRNRPTAITKVELPNGDSELPRRWRVRRTKAFTDGVAYKAVEILQQNIVSGTGGNASIGCPSAGGKTGTTDRNTDAWFVGFTPQLSTAVWVGYPKRRVEMSYLYGGGPVDGGTYPAEIWGEYMSRATGGRCPSFPQPKEPFVGSSFFGKYSRSGVPESQSTDSSYIAPAEPVVPQEQPAPQPQPQPEPVPDDGGAGGDEGFDPDQYESPPQEPPATAPPGGDGETASPGGGATAPEED